MAPIWVLHGASTGGPIAGGWTPANLSNLLAWYKADTGVTVDGSNNVTAVSDQKPGGTKYNLTVSGTGTIPFSSTAFNGFAAFNFNHATVGLLTQSNGVSLGGTTLSVFAAAALNNSSTSFVRIASYQAQGDSFDYQSTTSAALLLQDSTNAGIAGYRNSAELGIKAVTYGANSRFASIWDGTNHTPYVNNVAGTSVASSSTFGSTGTICIGCDVIISAANSWTGPVAEVVITSGNNTGDLTNVDNYFRQRFNL